MPQRLRQHQIAVQRFQHMLPRPHRIRSANFQRLPSLPSTHRIGQKATVFAYRLVVQGSIEEKIRQLQRSKSALAQDILGEERFSQALSIDDLQFLFESPEAAV